MGSHSLDRGSPRGRREVAGLAGAAGVVHEGHHLDLGAHAALEGEEQAVENITWACRAVIGVNTSREISHVYVTGNVLFLLES